MNVTPTSNLTFGWDLLTHDFMAKKALAGSELTDDEIKYVGEHSKDPDIMRKERVDVSARHFIDILHEDPSFGMVNDDLNNALSAFINHNREAVEAAKAGNREQFLLKMAHAVHYLQDASTPMHVDHGNYFTMLLRLPMHLQFERGKKLGASSRLNILEKGYVYEELPVTSLESLLNNTAYYAVQPENRVKYTNVKKWFEIQQRCVNRGINASKAYFDFILKYLPKR